MMPENIFSKKMLMPAGIVFFGILIAAAFLFFHINKNDANAAAPQWTEKIGRGFSAPACSSSTPTVTCSGGSPVANISWAYGGQHGTCSWVNVSIAGDGSATSQPCNGSWNSPALANNTSYSYTVQWWYSQATCTRTRGCGKGCTECVEWAPGVIDTFSGSFSTPNCAPLPGSFSLSEGGAIACNSVPLSWTASANADAYRILRGSPRVDISPYQPYTALNYTDTSVSQNTTYPYQIEAYNAVGTNRSNEISVTTPYCSPTVDISASPSSVFQGQTSTITWSSTNTTVCSATGNWSGSKPLSGSEVSSPLSPPSAVFTLSCTGPGGGASNSATVTVLELALPNWQEILPR